MRVRALSKRIIQQFFRDKRTLALLFLAPLLILTLVYYVFGGQSSAPRVGLVNAPANLSDRLAASKADVTSYPDAETAEKALRQGKIEAWVDLGKGPPSIRLEGSDPSKSKAVLVILQQALSASTSPSSAITPQITYLHGSADMSLFDSIGPVLIGFFSFFFVFLLAGVAFLRERTTGTLERLLATPIRRSEVVLGYLAGFSLFTLTQAALIAAFAVWVLGITLAGSFALLLLLNLLLTMTALTLGTLLSTFANTEFQIIQFIPIVIVPQVFFSGLFDLGTMSPWLQKLSYAMPLYYGGDALRGVMLRGEGFSDIAVDAFVLLGFSLLFAVLNVFALKKQRAI